jgi:hypothetical protein
MKTNGETLLVRSEILRIAGLGALLGTAGALIAVVFDISSALTLSVVSAATGVVAGAIVGRRNANSSKAAR